MLETAENFRTWKQRGLDRLEKGIFPIKVPVYRRLNPYLREYLYFLHSLDPARFTIARLGERYGLKESTVRRVIAEFGSAYFLRNSGLTSHKRKQLTREQKVLEAKERKFGRALGWEEVGDEDIGADARAEHEEEFQGWRSTLDWVRRQNTEVEMMSAFPMAEKRDPMPKRVDVDLMVNEIEDVDEDVMVNTRRYKVMNWIDPTDKVSF